MTASNYTPKSNAEQLRDIDDTIERLISLRQYHVELGELENFEIKRKRLHADITELTVRLERLENEHLNSDDKVIELDQRIRTVKKQRALLLHYKKIEQLKKLTAKVASVG